MENLGWGLQMTVLGMGLVFTLLALLWGILKLVLMFDTAEEEFEHRHPHADAEEDQVEASSEPVPVKEVAADLAAAIIVAAVEHQKTLNRTINGMAADTVAAIMVATMKHKLAVHGSGSPSVRFWPGTEPSRWAADGRMRQINSWKSRRH